jgi:hypothetical protein
MNEIYYPRVRQILGSSFMPADILNARIDPTKPGTLDNLYYGTTLANLQNYKNAGFYPGQDVELNIDWNRVRGELAGLKVPFAIDGQSWYGLNSGAKNSVDKNYLSMAEQTGRCEILPLHVVTDIGQSEKHNRYVVWVNEINVDGSLVRRKVITTERLFLAAGAMGTPPLLVKAKAKGTLPKLNSSRPQLGDQRRLPGPARGHRPVSNCSTSDRKGRTRRSYSDGGLQQPVQPDRHDRTGHAEGPRDVPAGVATVRRSGRRTGVLALRRARCAASAWDLLP